jgi:hypothetical protein
MELDAMDATDHFSLDTVAFQPLLDSMADWTNETIPQSLDDFNWGGIDPSPNVGV